MQLSYNSDSSTLDESLIPLLLQFAHSKLTIPVWSSVRNIFHLASVNHSISYMLAFLIGSPIESATIKFEFSLLFNLITYFYFLDFINTPGGHHQEGLIKRYREIHFDCSTDFRNTSVRFTVLWRNDVLRNDFSHKKFVVILKIDLFFMMFVDIFKKMLMMIMISL